MVAATAAVTHGIAPDAWLSELLGKPAWRVDCECLDIASALSIASSGPGFFYTRVAATNLQTLHQLEDLGFRVIDMTVTLDAPAPSLQGLDGNAARFATPSDRSAVADIAASSFASSRLHLDPSIAKSVADRSRAEWASNFFAGKRGSVMIVAEDGNEVAAFLLLIGPVNGLLTIDLIAVRRQSRRLGLGATCIRYAAKHISGVEQLRVGTQAANIGSMRFYEGLGFQTAATHYVLHLHRT